MTSLNLKPKEKFRFHDFHLPEWADKIILVASFGLLLALVVFLYYNYSICPDCKRFKQEESGWQWVLTYFFAVYGINAVFNDLGTIFKNWRRR